jgi:hypothetical protein
VAEEHHCGALWPGLRREHRSESLAYCRVMLAGEMQFCGAERVGSMMMRLICDRWMRAMLALLCIATVPLAQAQQAQFQQAQFQQDQAPQNQAPLLTLDQLDRLVAPIALYPDPLLSQVLAASTYPLEIVEAQQWLEQNRNLSSQQLVEAAKQQNWDPSVQLLVGFPEVMALVTRDIRWTTDLGNAFLAQQADVMNAIQQLRSQASNNGRLRTTPQQVVSTETENQQSAIQIQPANPQVIYPPVYNPAYVWGPQVAGGYPALYDYPQGGGGYGFGSGINIGGLFSGLLSAAGTIGAGVFRSGLGFGIWGWVLNWFTHSLFLNGSFFNGLGYHNYGGGFRAGGAFAGRTVWAHDSAHRLGVPYARGFSSGGYRAAAFNSSRFAGRASDGWHRAGLGEQGVSRSGWHESASAKVAQRPTSNYASNFRGSAAFDRAPQRGTADHFNFKNSAPREESSHFSSNFSSRASTPHASTPHFSAPHFSSPRGASHSGGSSHSGGHSSGGHSGGGHSGKDSHKH